MIPPRSEEADLKTFKIGDVPLTVSGNTISGELPWSYTYASATASNAKFAEFTMGKYAMMYDDGNQPYYSNGDVNGDGEAEDRDANNNGFVFVRGTKDNEVLFTVQMQALLALLPLSPLPSRLRTA